MAIKKMPATAFETQDAELTLKDAFLRSVSPIVSFEALSICLVMDCGMIPGQTMVVKTR